MSLLAQITSKVNAIACKYAPDCLGIEQMSTLQQLQLLERILEFAERELNKKDK